MKLRARADYPTFVVLHPQRGYLQERAKQWGWHWETTGRAWYRSAKYASKYPRTVATQLAIEHGGITLPTPSSASPTAL
jgi:hypothetical protein